MAQLLEQGKVDSARIRVEGIIRSDVLTELHELLELYCELLIARAGLIDASPTCDPGLEEAVKSILYAAPKTEIKELQTVRTMLAEKYGKEFVFQAMENVDGKVSPKVVKKLSVEPPREELVQGYLEEISLAYGVDWPKESQELQQAPSLDNLIDDDSYLLGKNDSSSNNGSNGGLGEQPIPIIASPGMKDLMGLEEEGGEKDEEGKQAAVVVNPPSPSTENPHPRVRLNSMELKPSRRMQEAGIAAQRSGEDKLDELARRFAALKKP